ncbi:MAG: DUF4936 family protein [Thiobacillus sp.]
MARAAYVYYRLRPGSAAAAAGPIDALLEALAPFCTDPPRRARRCDDAATWMEIYEGVSDWDGFEAAHAAEVRRLSIAAFVDGDRHLECFVA